MTDEQKKLDTYFIGHPKPLFSLSMVEVWERFSFYGIRPLLVLFMSAMAVDGGLGLSNDVASAIVGIFAGSLYLAALPGGYLADNYFGQKKATFIGAVLIACGHVFIGLSYFVSYLFFVGLIFIVLGSGLFKTCASVMVGMLYKENDTRRDSGFTIFYMGINIGGFVAPLVCGLVQKQFGWHLGFTAGGIGMLIALIIFYFKTIPDLEEYNKIVGTDKSFEAPSVKNNNIGIFLVIAIFVVTMFVTLCIMGTIILNPIAIAKNMVWLIIIGATIYFIYLLLFNGLDSNEKKNLFVFLILFIASSFFWSTFEQQPTSFNLFAQNYTDRYIFGWEIPTAWFQSINSLFIIILAPFVGALWVFLSKKNFNIHSITKFALGTIGAALSFAVMMVASMIIVKDGGLVSPLWLVISFLFLTLGELSLSPVGLSIMTQIAPRVMRGQVMGLWFVSISLGNVVAGLIGGELDINSAESLPNLFGKCVIMLLIVAIILFLIKNPIKKMLASSSD